MIHIKWPQIINHRVRPNLVHQEHINPLNCRNYSLLIIASVTVTHRIYMKSICLSLDIVLDRVLANNFTSPSVLV